MDELPSSPRDAIVDFVNSFERGGFQVLDFQYLSGIPPIEYESVTMALVEMVHPDFDQPPSPELIASFAHLNQYHLLWGSLVYPPEEDDLQYLFDSMLGLLEGMSFDS